MKAISQTFRSSRIDVVAFLLSQRGVAIIIALVTVVLYSPALWNGFTNWDDEANFLTNPHYRGLGWSQLRWMFTAFHLGHWIPLTWVTLGLDYVVWGMNPIGYHLTNLFLHAANAGLFYLVARRLLGKAMRGPGEIPLSVGAGMAALFFALHPLRAESVAWVTERRDVLSGLFFLLTILTYLKALESEESQRRRWLAGSVGCYALALASKSIVMTLPFVLILLDIYPLGRIGGRWRAWIAPEARCVWEEKVPYLLLALVGGLIALYVILTTAVVTPFVKLPLSSRVAVALWSLWFYFWKTFFPSRLSPLYELPEQVNILAPQFIWAAIAVGILMAGFWLCRRRWPAGLVVWVGYGAMLLPVSGLLHAGEQLTADRYSYLACMGWALLVGAGVGAVARALIHHSLAPPYARLALAAAVVWLLALAAITWNQVQVWRDPDTLWRYALDIDPKCAACHNSLGSSLGNRGLLHQAIEHFERALILRPNYGAAHSNMGLALLMVGEPAKAGAHFQWILSRDPGNVDARLHLGEALVKHGQPREAVEHLERVVRQGPDHAVALTYLGMALADLGRPEEAIPHFQRAIALQQNTPLPRLGLARAYLSQGNAGAAREEFEVLRRLDPGLAQQIHFK